VPERDQATDPKGRELLHEVRSHLPSGRRALEHGEVAFHLEQRVLVEGLPRTPELGHEDLGPVLGEHEHRERSLFESAIKAAVAHVIDHLFRSREGTSGAGPKSMHSFRELVGFDDRCRRLEALHTMVIALRSTLMPPFTIMCALITQRP
jgi:hypothetical protein